MSPEQNNPTAAALVRIATEIQHHSGPLPSPEQLQRYDQILPGAADRIIRMAEQQSQHRIQIEKQVIDSNTFSQKAGVIFGFVIAMTAIVGGIYLAANGKSGVGLTSIIGALSALVGVFLYGKIQQRKELVEKKERSTLQTSQP